MGTCLPVDVHGCSPIWTHPHYVIIEYFVVQRTRAGLRERTGKGTDQPTARKAGSEQVQQRWLVLLSLKVMQSLTAAEGMMLECVVLY